MSEALLHSLVTRMDALEQKNSNLEQENKSLRDEVKQLREQQEIGKKTATPIGLQTFLQDISTRLGTCESGLRLLRISPDYQFKDVVASYIDKDIDAAAEWTSSTSSSSFPSCFLTQTSQYLRDYELIYGRTIKISDQHFKDAMSSLESLIPIGKIDVFGAVRQELLSLCDTSTCSDQNITIELDKEEYRNAFFYSYYNHLPDNFGDSNNDVNVEYPAATAAALNCRKVLCELIPSLQRRFPVSDAESASTLVKGILPYFHTHVREKTLTGSFRRLCMALKSFLSNVPGVGGAVLPHSFEMVGTSKWTPSNEDFVDFCDVFSDSIYHLRLHYWIGLSKMGFSAEHGLQVGLSKLTKLESLTLTKIVEADSSWNDAIVAGCGLSSSSPRRIELHIDRCKQLESDWSAPAGKYHSLASKMKAVTIK